MNKEVFFPYVSMHLGVPSVWAAISELLVGLHHVLENQYKLFNRLNMRQNVNEALEGTELAANFFPIAEVDAQTREGATLLFHLLVIVSVD